MKKYIVTGKVTAFISVELEAENKKEAIEKACEECSGSMNFVDDGIAGGTMWTGKRSGRDNGVPQEMKRRWVYRL